MPSANVTQTKHQQEIFAGVFVMTVVSLLSCMVLYLMASNRYAALLAVQDEDGSVPYAVDREDDGKDEEQSIESAGPGSPPGDHESAPPPHH